MDEWLTVALAARMLGYSTNYFRVTFCDEARPLLTIRSWRGPKGQRRLCVSRSAVMALIQGQEIRPEGNER